MHKVVFLWFVIKKLTLAKHFSFYLQQKQMWKPWTEFKLYKHGAFQNASLPLPPPSSSAAASAVAMTPPPPRSPGPPGSQRKSPWGGRGSATSPLRAVGPRDLSAGPAAPGHSGKRTWTLKEGGGGFPHIGETTYQRGAPERWSVMAASPGWPARRRKRRGQRPGRWVGGGCRWQTKWRPWKVWEELWGAAVHRNLARLRHHLQGRRRELCICVMGRLHI